MLAMRINPEGNPSESPYPPRASGAAPFPWRSSGPIFFQGSQRMLRRPELPVAYPYQFTPRREHTYVGLLPRPTLDLVRA